MTNLSSEQVNQAKNLLEQSRNIVMALPNDTKLDNIAAALTLYLSLSAAGKQVSLISPNEITVNYNQLIGVDKISTSLNSQPGRNLIISFPYQEGSIEKVSYNIENDTFNLVIEPRDGYPTITPDMMRYSSDSGNYEMVVTIGCWRLEELGQLYMNYKNLFSDKPLINIDTNNTNTNFGKINLIDSNLSSISELVLGLMEQMGLTIEIDMATNLLAGISSETENFSSAKTTATTFENAAMLLKLGARKPKTILTKQSALPQFERDRKQGQFSAFKSTTPFDKGPKLPLGRSAGQQSQPQSFFKPKTQMQPQPQNAQPFIKSGQQTRQMQAPSTREQGKPPETPPDWLKPKIYKGSTLL